MTVFLALDSASPRFALALVRDNDVLAAILHDKPQDHSRGMISAIDRACEQAQVRPDHLVAVIGPGSYAGLRVGLATVQGIALARNLPVTGIGTLRAIAEASGRASVVAIHPVGRGEFAAQVVHAGKSVGEVRLVSPEELTADCAGEGAGEYGGIEVGPLERCLAAVRLAGTTASTSPTDLDAIYVREPSTSRPRATR